MEEGREGGKEGRLILGAFLWKRPLIIVVSNGLHSVLRGNESFKGPEKLNALL